MDTVFASLALSNTLLIFRLEEGPLEINLMVNSCKVAARIRETMNLAPKMVTHKVGVFLMMKIRNLSLMMDV